MKIFCLNFFLSWIGTGCLHGDQLSHTIYVIKQGFSSMSSSSQTHTFWK